MAEFLASIPYAVLLIVVGGLIGVESIGLPLPGETVLVAALLIALEDGYSPWWIFAVAVVGAVIGDNLGYLAGSRARELLHQASWVLFVIAAVVIVAAVIVVFARRKRRLAHPQPKLTPERAALPLKVLLSEAAEEGRKSVRRDAKTETSRSTATGS